MERASGESSPAGAGAEARKASTLAEATRANIHGVEEVGGGAPGTAPPASVTLGNDPSAGSPTETLLRLLLPLNDQV